MKSTSIIYRFKTGHVEDVLLDIQRSFIQYKRHNSKVYIGITNNPKIRFSAHLRSSNVKWERMVVVYKTSSIKNVKEVEFLTTILNYVHLENKNFGGGGKNSTGAKYLYFLLKK